MGSFLRQCLGLVGSFLAWFLVYVVCRCVVDLVWPWVSGIEWTPAMLGFTFVSGAIFIALLIPALAFLFRRLFPYA